MKYSYAYKTSDGQRHEATIEAASREAVFTTLRAQGIKPIKVIAADGSRANGEVIVRGVRKRVVTVVALAAAVIAGAFVFKFGRDGSMSRPQIGQSSTVELFSRPTFSPAQPLPRQMILGDRTRLAQAVASLTNAAERVLAAFAEPGRPLPQTNDARPTDAEFANALASPLWIASDELTESIDLKRIITGLKDEMRRFIVGGGSVSDYFAECVKRQKQEIAYRTRAEKHLKKMLDSFTTSVDAEPSPLCTGRDKNGLSDTPSAKIKPASVHLHPSPSPDYSKAYSYWLKANAQLQSMGIYPLPLPDRLRDYQLAIDIEE